MSDDSILQAIDAQIHYHLQRVDDFSRARSAITGVTTHLRDFVPSLAPEIKPTPSTTATISITGGGTIGDYVPPSQKWVKKISDETRLRMKRAQQNRWAAVQGKPALAAKTAPSRQISEAGKKRIAAAQKKRWAKIKKEKAVAGKANLG